MTLQLALGEASQRGPRRDNQDALRVVTPAPALASSKGYLLAMADGVSQCSDGALAAQSSLQALAMDYYATPETWPATQSLERLLQAHNRWLLAQAPGQSLLTTLSCLVLRGRRYTLAHIGDCRIYRYADGRLQRLTEDHVWPQANMQHVLRRALGLDQSLQVDYQQGSLQPGERYLLLSDGVWAYLADSQISQLLAAGHDCQATCQALVDSALRNGGQDNASALLVHVLGVPENELAAELQERQDWPTPPRLQPGQHFEGWQVEALWRRSRQAVLYRVRDAQGLAWLLKTLPEELATDSAARQALLHEEWLMRRLAGQSVADLHDMPGRRHLYFVQRQLDAQPLSTLLEQQGPWRLAPWLELMRAMLGLLGQLQRRHIVHRDLTLDNLLLDAQGRLYLVDFGLAYCPGLHPEAPPAGAGTPSYLAPELFAGAAPHSQQDLYALGVGLYRLLTGHYPYGEIEAFQRPRFGVAKPPSRYRPELPDWVDALLLDALHADPRQRYESAEHWQHALQQGERRPLRHTAQPWLIRQPLRLWQGIALLALLGNLLLLIALLH